ncbi:MAG TPA: preprotein translocase subunit SecG [Rhizobiaceae bacterium]|nr:preprotein translocase subunit SecG [Rhizobiaceae bacterium]
METVIIVIHLLIVIALVGVVLLQRSEGGGLGIGGGSGFMTARGAANALTRTTAILAAAFFASSLALSLIARYGDRPIDILDRLPATNTQQEGGSGGVLDQLGGSDEPSAPTTDSAQPQTEAPSGTAPEAAQPQSQAAPTDTAPESAQPQTPESQVPTGQ